MKPTDRHGRCLTLTFAVSSLVTISAVANGQRVPPACQGTWSAPANLQREGGQPVYVEGGPIAAIRGATIAIGAPTFFWLARDRLFRTDPVPDSAEAVWSLSQAGARIDDHGVATAVPSVGGQRRRYGADLVGWRNDALTVVWPSADVEPRVQRDRPPSSDMTGLDVATFDGTRWSDHLTILSGEKIELGRLPVSRAEMAFERSVIAVKATDGARPLVRVARKVGAVWSTADWADGSIIHYASATTAADGATVMVTTLTPPNGVAGVYSIRTATWPPSPADWSPPQRIDSLRSLPFSFGRFSWAHLGGDSLLVVWDQSGGSEHFLTTALSADGAKSWRLLQPLVHDSGIDGESVAVDSKGRVHVVFRSAPGAGVVNAPGRVMHAMWNGATWSRPAPVSTAASLTDPGLGFASGGRLVATWTEAVFDANGASPKTIVAVWTPCVPR